ncbi:MAG: GDSL-type esterase/lipase family protein [Candidatus Nanopelagicales bacterium]
MKRLMGVVAGIAAAASGVAAFTVARVQARATGDVDGFLASLSQRQSPIVVAGASIVRGRASVDFVEILRERLPERTFVNAGINGNVAWELLQRLDDVLACEPAQVVILIGTNDVQATLSPGVMRQVRESKHLPEAPTIHFYADCLARVVARLRAAGVDVGLCSLPPIGQDLAALVNQRVREANAAISGVCDASGATYLPVYERLTDLLLSQGATTGPAWTGSWLPGIRSLVEHFVLGRSYDDIALSAGWVFTPDGVHMDSTGARVTADVVEGWLSRQSSTS